MLTVNTILEYLGRLAPLALAAEWDNVGLLVGDRDSAVRRVLTCLTITPPVVAEAIESSVQLIVTHHPVLFRGVKRLTTTTPEGRMLLELVRAGIAVYSPHTAYDNALGGINDELARRLGLTKIGSLRPHEGSRHYKVVVFVPEQDLDRVSNALFAAGAGQIGQYTECSFRQAGIGTFFGSEATNPAVGQKGRREEVSEWRLEALCPEEAVEAVQKAIRHAHSYEEPAYDVYPLRSMATWGEGRVGDLPQPLPSEDLARLVKQHLHAHFVQLVGDPARKVQRVAVVCGAGGELLSDAVQARADVLITGELRFHDVLSAAAQGLVVLLTGHFASERCGVETLAQKLRQQWPELEVWASRRETDPLGLIY